MLATAVKAFYRELMGPERETNVQASRNGALYVAQGLPPYTEMSRRGEGWSMMNTAALAALVVRPTTVSQSTLYNNNPSGGPSFIIDRVFCFNLVSTAAQARFGIWLCLHKYMTAPTSPEITVANGNTGKVGTGDAIGAIFKTPATVLDDGWFPWGSSVDTEPTGVLPGPQISVEVAGRLIVPPGRGISIQVVASAVADTFTTGFSFYREQLDMDP